MSDESKIPLSTLKVNSKKLKDLGIIQYGNYKKVELTASGVLVLKIMEEVNL